MGTPQEPELRKVRVGDSEMILCRLADGEVVAFGTHCPHQGTDLMEASFFDGNLRCPHHLYLYDPRTGENVVPSRDARPENLWNAPPRLPADLYLCAPTRSTENRRCARAYTPLQNVRVPGEARTNYTCYRSAC